MQRNLKNDGTRCEKCGGSFAVGASGLCANCSTPEPREFGWPQRTWLANRLLHVRAERYQNELGELARERV